MLKGMRPWLLKYLNSGISICEKSTSTMKTTFTLLLLLLITACKPQQSVTERSSRDSTIIREVPYIVQVPGAVIRSPSINIDSLVNLLKSGIKPEVINNTLISEDPETKLRVGILIDELGNLTALCEQQDRMIETLSKEIEHWRERYEQTTVYVEPNLWDRIRTFINNFGLIVVIALILILFLRR